MADPRPLTFWHVAGDIIWRGDGRCVPIEARQAVILRREFSEETRTAYAAGDILASRRTAALWIELTKALDALEEWRRVVGIPRFSSRKAA